MALLLWLAMASASAGRPLPLGALPPASSQANGRARLEVSAATAQLAEALRAA